MSKGKAVFRPKYLAVLMSGASLLGSPALAQETGDTENSPVTNAVPLAETQSTSGQANAVGEIIVTAQKRAQSLQDVPISITALDSAALEANRVQDLRDLNALAPNLTVRLSNGGSQIPTFTLRGLLTGGTAAGTDKGVALYLDGVYLQAVQGSVFDFADIERIEVLKGPQGTLFGRNSTGGAISITTRNPSGEFGFSQKVGIGNYDSLRSKTTIDTPSFGPFSATATYLHSERRGDIRNLGAGTVWDYGPATGGVIGKRVSPDYLGGDNVEAFMGTILADLGPDLEAFYKYDYSENNYTPNAVGSSLLLPGSLLEGIYNASPNPSTPISLTRPDAVNNDFTTHSRTESEGHNFTVSYSPGDIFTFKNILAFRSSLVNNTFALGALGGLITIPIPVAPGVSVSTGTFNSAPGLQTDAIGVPFQTYANFQYNREKQWSEEFQITAMTDWFTITAGYIHFQNQVWSNGVDGSFNSYVIAAFNGQQTSAEGTPYVVPGNPGYVPTYVKSVSDAWYIQPELHLTDTVDVVVGLRITEDRKDGLETFPNQAIAAAENPGATFPIQSPIRYRDSQISTLVGLNWQPTPEILVYAKYADGYISGGQLATIRFNPEKAFSYEGGIKAELFDRRLRSNLAVFHVDYTSMQFTTAGILTGVPSSALFGQAVISAGNARARGFEWENTLVPITGVTLGANVGYTDFKFDQDTIFPGFQFTSGAPGYREFARPKWTLNLSAQYDSPEIFRGGYLTARVDGAFRSETLMSSDIAPGSGPTAQADPRVVEATTIPDTWIVNGRVALTGMQVGPLETELALWGRNIFDNDELTQASALDLGSFGYVISTIYERSRAYGLELSLRY